MTMTEIWILIIGFIVYKICKYEINIRKEYKKKKAWIDDIERRYPQTLKKHEARLEEFRDIYSRNIRRGSSQDILDDCLRNVRHAEEVVFENRAYIAVIEHAPPDIKQAYRSIMWNLAFCSTPNLNQKNMSKQDKKNKKICFDWYREWLAEQESEEGKRERTKEESYNSSQL